MAYAVNKLAVKPCYLIKHQYWSTSIMNIANKNKLFREEPEQLELFEDEI